MLVFLFIGLLFALVCVNLSDAVVTELLGETKPCQEGRICEIDGYVGSKVIYEDDRVRVWNFTLPSGAMTSMHRHDYDYHFVAIQPTQLEVYGENGSVLFNFRAEGTLGFEVVGDYLHPISNNVQLPWLVPRVHSAKNIGPSDYYEILFESKISPSIEDPIQHADEL